MGKFRSWKLAALLGTAAVMLAAMLVIAHWPYASANVPAASVAKVNGDPVTQQELERLIEPQRAAVIDYFKRTYSADYGEHFWNTSFNGEIPNQLLRKRVMEEAVKTKVIFQLAQSWGLIADTSYPALLREMAKENLRRSETVKAGLPVYGPVQFNESGFVQYYLSRLLIQLREELAQREPAVTDEQLMKHYETLKDSLFRLEDHVRFIRLSVSYTEEGKRSNASGKQQAKALMEAIKNVLDQGLPVAEAVKQVEEGGEPRHIQMAEEQFNSSTAREYFKTLPELYRVLASGEDCSGPVGPVIDDPASGRFIIPVITARETTGYQSFEEQKNNVRKHYMEAMFNDYLSRRVSEAEVIDEGGLLWRE